MAGQGMKRPLRFLPASTLLALLIGFAVILGLNYYSESLGSRFSQKKLEAMELIASWQELESATAEMSTSGNLIDAQKHWSRTINEFDDKLNRYVRSEIISDIRSKDDHFDEMVIEIENLWSVIKSRLENLHLRINLYSVEHAFDPAPRISLLQRLGRLSRDDRINAEFMEVSNLTDDIKYVVSTSSDRFIGVLNVMVERLSTEIDDWQAKLRLINLAFSLLIIAGILLFTYRVQKAVQRSEKRYRTLQANIPVGVVRAIPSGQIVTANPALVAMYGYSSRESLFQTDMASLFVEPEKFGELIQNLDENGAVTNFETRMKRSDGANIWVSFNLQAVLDKTGTIAFIDGVVEDITQRRQAEMRLQAAHREKYEQAKRIAGIFAHEIRNALFPAAAALNRIKSKSSLNPDTVESLKKYAAIAERAIANAADATRLISLHNKLDTEVIPESVNLAEVIDKVLTNNQMQISEGKIKVTVDGLSDVWIRSNPGQLVLAINNLLLNSIYAITGRTDPTINIEWSQGDHQVILTFSDNGHGISRENLPRVFELFFSTKTDNGGTGIGLATTRKIVEMYDGKIDVESIEGTSTRFTIHFQKARQAPAFID